MAMRAFGWSEDQAWYSEAEFYNEMPARAKGRDGLSNRTRTGGCPECSGPDPRHVNAPQPWLSLADRAKSTFKIKELYIMGSSLVN